MDYEFFMEKAIILGKKAFKENEIPIGCIIVFNNKIIGQGYNKRNSHKNVLYHAEILAINEACKNLNDWRLEDCVIFTTIEPCPMCAGAIFQSRIKKLVYGAENKKTGSAGSVLNILQEEKFNHKTEIVSGILKDECKNLMQDFFKTIRK